VRRDCRPARTTKLFVFQAETQLRKKFVATVNGAYKRIVINIRDIQGGVLIRISLSIATLALLAAASSFAQSTGIVTGIVVDPSGAVVPSANVSCKNSETDLTAAVLTNSAGVFRFPDLPVGSYEITITKEGFGTLVRSGIRLLTNQTIDQTPRLMQVALKLRFLRIGYLEVCRKRR